MVVVLLSNMAWELGLVDYRRIFLYLADASFKRIRLTFCEVRLLSSPLNFLCIFAEPEGIYGIEKSKIWVSGWSRRSFPMLEAKKFGEMDNSFSRKYLILLWLGKD